MSSRVGERLEEAVLLLFRRVSFVCRFGCYLLFPSSSAFSPLLSCCFVLLCFPTSASPLDLCFNLAHLLQLASQPRSSFLVAPLPSLLYVSLHLCFSRSSISSLVSLILHAASQSLFILPSFVHRATRTELARSRRVRCKLAF